MHAQLSNCHVMDVKQHVIFFYARELSITCLSPSASPVVACCSSRDAVDAVVHALASCNGFNIAALVRTQHSATQQLTASCYRSSMHSSVIIFPYSSRVPAAPCIVQAQLRRFAYTLLFAATQWSTMLFCMKLAVTGVRLNCNLRCYVVA
jgi:hypothetical protein